MYHTFCRSSMFFGAHPDGTDFDGVLTLLYFAVQTASRWCDGLNYKVVNYLEGKSTDVGELLDRWNK